MGSKKATQAYVLENLECFAKDLVHIGGFDRDGAYSAINLESLQKAIKLLPRKDRENIERFWGLTGKINHSKKLQSLNTKDIALIRHGDEAIKSLRKLLHIDFLSIYNESFKAMIAHLCKKINKKGVNIPDIDAIKHLMTYLVFLQNGHKMPFEEDPMTIDTVTNENYVFDEYLTILETYRASQDIPDESINLKLIFNLLDMLDWQDALVIKKTFGIEVPKEELPKKYVDAEIEPIYTFGGIRQFKERVFSYGCWEVVSKLIFGEMNEIDKLEEFMKCLDTIRKDWSKVADYKVGQRQLQTSRELRNLDLYNIGGLEFTDVYEVMFIYLERNIISPDN